MVCGKSFSNSLYGAVDVLSSDINCLQASDDQNNEYSEYCLAQVKAELDLYLATYLLIITLIPGNVLIVD